MRVRILPNPPRACSSDSRAPVLQAGGRECNSRRVHQICNLRRNVGASRTSGDGRRKQFRSIAQPAEHPVLTREVGGSTPSGPTKFCPCSPIGRGSRFKTGPVKVRILPRAPKAFSNPSRAAGFHASLAELAYAAVLETVRSRFESWARYQVQRRGICHSSQCHYGSYRMARKRAVTPRLDEHRWFDSSTAHQLEKHQIGF